MVASLNPTGKGDWAARPTGRNAHRTLVPIVGNTSWAQALGPTQLAWMFLREVPAGWTRPSYPDVWFIYRANPAISFWDSAQMVETMSKAPFTVAFAYTPNETNVLADILLPEATDFESLQLIRPGRTVWWDYRGAVLRQPAIKPRGETRDFTWITGELVRRLGLTEKYVQALNRGAGVPYPLKGENYDFALQPGREYGVEEIWDAACKAASARISGGKEIRDLAWFKKHSLYAYPMPRTKWYLYPAMVRNGLRFELPYQERLTRIGRQLGNRLHERELYWWDEQLTEYKALPPWEDIPGHWLRALEHSGIDPDDYPFWLITTKSMQYAAGGNAEIPLMNEVSRNMRHHGRVLMNTATARRLGIRDGDLVEVRSPIAATRGQALAIEGVRPDTLVIAGQFDHWATPFAKDLGFPSLNTVASMSLDLTDSTGSGADLVRVSVRRLESVSANAGLG
jgi:phenylacetyl-CoA:acceptor oxidoreductase